MSAPQRLASVIVTNYNYARYLGTALESALSQGYSPLEVVVVDDGSTDQSLSIIDSFGDRVIAVRKPNGGMASALNAGFRASSGDVVIFLDSDDVLLPTAVAAAVACFADPDLVKVHWAMEELDAAGSVSGRLVEARLPSGDFRKRVMRLGPLSVGAPPTSGNAWSRRFLEAVMPMPEAELRRHADVYLHTLACASGSIGRISAPQAQYRIHGRNDFATEPIAERLERQLYMYHYRCRILSEFLRSRGTRIDPSTWKQEGSRPYRTLSRRVATLRNLAAATPPGSHIILADDGDLGGGTVFRDRVATRLPLPARDADHLTAKDDEVLRELGQKRRGGAEFVAFVGPAIQRSANFPRLMEHLRQRHTCELAHEDVLVYALADTSAIPASIGDGGPGHAHHPA